MTYLERKREQTKIFKLFLDGEKIALFHKETGGKGREPRRVLSVSYSENNGIIYRDTFTSTGGVNAFAGHCYDVVDFSDIEKTREKMSGFERDPLTNESIK